ncbi:MAG: hypothetical protein HXX09_11825 [Bacteroidetes bacterium]|nr:hypothetical protein [Bacteroidota bacterium]
MKRILQFMMLGAFFLLFTGCPYESDVALSDPKYSKIDNLLIGKWLGTEEIDSTKKIELYFSKLNSNIYSIKYKQKRRNEMELKLKGFVTILNNIKILNIYDIVDDKSKSPRNKFLFFKYEIVKENIKISFASDKIVKKRMTSRTELRNFFINNMNKDGFFEKMDDEGKLTFKKVN